MSIIPICIVFIVFRWSFSNSVDVLPWETYLELGTVEKPLGLIFDQSLLSHRHFMIGYLCLHSFMYDAAQEAFQLAIESDPTLVEAHIGRLLGHKQALWSYTNRSGALQVWSDTWSIFTQQNVLLTPFQSIYLNTAYQWFSYENISAGEEAFLNSMLNLTKEFPSNIDAQTLLGLAYINWSYRQSFELKLLETPALLSARTILQDALVHEPAHPGCLHYLIHAFDVPQVDVALQAVSFAHKYGQVAYTASHAQHMPTHIWTRIGAWSLAQISDARSVEVSWELCLIKQQVNYTQFNTSTTALLTLSELMTWLNSTQLQMLLYCDRDNRAHSQQWLIYSYLQMGRYRKSIDILTDLILSNELSPFDQYYLPFLYAAQAHVVINVFFWAMYDIENNQKIFTQTMDELLMKMNFSSIQILMDNNTDSTFVERYEIVARFADCIRLLFVNNNDTNSTTSIEYHLSRIMEILSIIQSKRNSTSIRELLMISEINALQWYHNGSLENCLIELEKATRIESSFNNDYNRPTILHIRAAELFALFLLITHRHYFSLASIYKFNNITVAVNDFPSYALRLYEKENQTDPHRIVNSLGIARAYAQMGRTNQASQIYEKLLRDCSDSTFSPNIDRLIIEEATAYLLSTKINQIKNNVCILHSSIFLIIFLLSIN